MPQANVACIPDLTNWNWEKSQTASTIGDNNEIAFETVVRLEEPRGQK